MYAFDITQQRIKLHLGVNSSTLQKCIKKIKYNKKECNDINFHKFIYNVCNNHCCFFFLLYTVIAYFKFNKFYSQLYLNLQCLNTFVENKQSKWQAIRYRFVWNKEYIDNIHVGHSFE